MSEDVKVVIAVKGTRAFVGVQSPNCDPIFITMEGGLDTALERVPELVEAARQQWAESPRYPKADLPEVKPPASPVRPAQATRQSATPQPRMF